MFKPLKKTINYIPLLAVPLAATSISVFAVDYPVVQIKQLNMAPFSKKNGSHPVFDSNYCLDAKNAGKSAQKVNLENCGDTNDNHLWQEIDRGDGFYSYQKLDSDYCLAVDKDNVAKQNVYLQQCDDNNDYQHWLKVDITDGQFRIENRKLSGFSLDSNSNGASQQSVKLSASIDDDQNQHWSLNYVTSGGATFVGGGGTVAGALPVSCEVPEDFTVVNTLSAMISEMKTSDVKVALAAGTYAIDEENIDLFTPQSVPGGKSANTLFTVDGNNSHYDFRCASIKYDTDLWAQFGSTQVYQLRTVGSENTISNLNIEDIGDTAPTGGAVGIVMDGRDNLIEGLILTSRGSSPYGLGDAYGKGGGPILAHKKHSSVLIRGLRNTFKQSTVFNNAYGHSVFMQGSETTLIDGVYIQGNLRGVYAQKSTYP